MTVDPVATKSTSDATPHATSDAASQAAETDSKKIDKVTTVLPTKDLPTKDLPTKDLPTKDLPTKDLPTKDLPTKDLPKKSPSEKKLPEKSPLAEDISFSKRSRRRHRRRVFKPKRRGRPRHMLPGGSR